MTPATTPRGCRTWVCKKSGRVDIQGAECKKGIEYVRKEYIKPVRFLTTTLAVEGAGIQRLSVKTNGKINKELLIPCIKYLKKKKVTPPVRVGEVIVENLLGTGVDLVSTNELE
jgi:CxxC motif-containing protein